MGQFDNFKSIAILFVGAVVISLAVIAFLNMEVQSRTTRGVRMRNENLVEVLGRKVRELMGRVRERNSYRRSVLLRAFLAGNGTRATMRQLRSVQETVSGGGRPGDGYRLRHGRKMHRLGELFFRQRNHTTAAPAGQPKSAKATLMALLAAVPTNRTVPANDTANSTQTHDHCYSTNDVLEIIAITCLVNFTFWFFIVFAVNTLTKDQKTCKVNSMESLLSVESPSEMEVNLEAGRGHELMGCSFEGGFGGGFPGEYAGPPAGPAPGPRGRCAYRPLEMPIPEDVETGEWVAVEMPRQHGIFLDRICVEEMKPPKKKKLISRANSHQVVNSQSMEDLLL